MVWVVVPEETARKIPQTLRAQVSLASVKAKEGVYAREKTALGDTIGFADEDLIDDQASSDTHYLQRESEGRPKTLEFRFPKAPGYIHAGIPATPFRFKLNYAWKDAAGKSQSFEGESMVPLMGPQDYTGRPPRFRLVISAEPSRPGHPPVTFEVKPSP